MEEKEQEDRKLNVRTSLNGKYKKKTKDTVTQALKEKKVIEGHGIKKNKWRLVMGNIEEEGRRVRRRREVVTGRHQP
ncbi:hypothetical protein E2C01_046452 [Portunus trituberculatus]|uniref:Uncharacterized protein n=1 Tax=Portunus trituberculatus TaxID=210409 RepID=A0A5B7FXY0_PORTR|nr:hypothetical protein [Portunus trituberculatus]